jgi:hypothetical protein
MLNQRSVLRHRVVPQLLRLRIPAVAPQTFPHEAENGTITL